MGLDDIRDESGERRSIQEPQPQQEDVLEAFDLRNNSEGIINTYKERLKLMQEKEFLRRDEESEKNKQM